MVQGRAGADGVVPLMVRVPESLRDRIKAAAEANGRSQNSEIVATLEEKYPVPVPSSTSEVADMVNYVSAGSVDIDMHERAAQMNQLLYERGVPLLIRVLDDVGARAMKSRVIIVTNQGMSPPKPR